MNEQFVEARILSIERRQAIIAESGLNDEMKAEIIDRLSCEMIQFLDLNGYSECSIELNLHNQK